MTELGRNYETESLGGGRFRSTISLKPVNYLKNGVYRRITNNLGASGDPAFPTGVDELCQFRLDTKIAGKSPLFSFGKGQSRVTLALLGANNGKGTVSGNSMLFPNAWDNADLKLTMAGHRLQKDIFLKTGHPTKFQFRINEHVGFDPETLTFGNDFRILQPVLHDPNGLDDVPLVWDVAQSGGKWILTVVLPAGDWAGWTLDPTLTLQPDATDGMDNILDGSNPDTNLGTNTQWLIHYGGYTEVAKFDLSLLVGCTINSATLELLCQVAGTAGTVTIARILAANSSWDEATSTWNKRDGVNVWAGSGGCSTSGTDYSSTPLYAADPGTAIGIHTYTLDTAEFALMAAANYGLVHSTAPWPPVHRFYWSSDHATPAYRPKFVVDYTVGGGPILASSIFHSAIHGGTLVR